MPNTTPGRLVEAGNPCAVKPGALNAALKKYPRRESVFEAVSFGIVVECGRSSVSLGLPMAQTVDLKLLERAHPEIAGFWSLASEMAERIFGADDIFHVLQRAGDKLAPGLISGRYDRGLAAAVRGNVGSWRSPSFRFLSESYRGPVSAGEARRSYVAELMNANAYHFIDSVPPIYPRPAMLARITGRVDLRLTLEPATGAVLGASAVSGHGLLTRNATDAAKQWRFTPESIHAETLNVTFNFGLRCP